MALLHRRSTSKRASQKMWENNAAMPDDASANDNVSSARPEPAAFVPTPFDEVIDISDLVAERRRLQRNLWAMRIITIVLLIAAIAVACFPLALQFESDRNLAATTATTAKEVAGWPYPQAEDKLTAARAYNKKLAESGQPILGEAVDPFAAAQGGSQASGEEKLPRAVSPLNEPSFHASGRAGRTCIYPSWLCSNISAIPAVPPKLASIWKGERRTARQVVQRFS